MRDPYRIDAPTVGDINDLALEPLEDSGADDDHDCLGLLPINRHSPLRHRRAAESLGRCFQKEFRYDFPPYTAGERTDSRDTVYLFVELDPGDTGCRATGAVGFRWRQWANSPHGYGLAWAWTHPYRRRQGMLASAWSVFKSRFGDFAVEGPLSPAMVGFLRKVDPQKLPHFGSAVAGS